MVRVGVRDGRVDRVVGPQDGCEWWSFHGARGGATERAGKQAGRHAARFDRGLAKPQPSIQCLGGMSGGFIAL